MVRNFVHGVRLCLLTLIVLLVSLNNSFSVVHAGSSAQSNSTDFAPLLQWESALVKGDAAALRSFYSASPAATIHTHNGETSADAEVSFWMGLKPKEMKIDVVQSESPQPGEWQAQVQAKFRAGTASGEQTFYVTESQVWQRQGDQWLITTGKHTDAARLEQPASTTKEIYPANVNAQAEINEAKTEAAKQGKRILLIFGANWCYDCHVLDLALHRTDIASVVAANYEVVHVDIGDRDKNQDLMREYQVPMSKGIPAIAVLESSGQLLFSQKNGEFENARSLTPEGLLEFLNKWKPQAR
jgi:hypothetical protein